MQKQFPNQLAVVNEDSMINDHAPHRTKGSDENFGKKAKTSQRSNKANSKSTSNIPRNVNFYRHLLNDTNANEHGVEWALQLRSPTSTFFKGEGTTTQPFAMGDRTLECQTQKKTTLDITNKAELHKITHLISHRLGATPSNGTVNFEAGLRSYGSSSDSFKNLEKRWCSIPKTASIKSDILAYPSYEETSKIKSWTAKNTTIKMHSAHDTLNSFPTYGLTKCANKNLAEIAHLFTAPGKTMPSLNWQLSMRNYGEPIKIKTDSNKTLGDLKKVNRKPHRL